MGTSCLDAIVSVPSQKRNPDPSLYRHIYDYRLCLPIEYQQRGDDRDAPSPM